MRSEGSRVCSHELAHSKRENGDMKIQEVEESSIWIEARRMAFPTPGKRTYVRKRGRGKEDNRDLHA